MLKRNEARVMADAFNLKAEETKKATAFEYCEKEISKAIEEVASNGRESVKVSLPTTIETDLVIKYLNDNGYVVSKLTHNYIMIKW